MTTIPKWRHFTNEQLAKIVSQVFSFRELARRLGYKSDGGGTIGSLHRMVRDLQLDTSHFKGQGWLNKNPDLAAFTIDSNKKNGSTLLKSLITIRGYRKCECCGITKWLGQEVFLQVHHINGEHSDNRLENLMMICPNCHALTSSYCIPKTKRK